MEDRITAGLFLEMTSRPAAWYGEVRVPEVLGWPSVARATWWENVCPDRSDLPRRLPEFSLLGVFEVGTDFVAPESPDGVAGYHFRHCPRPGQGRLTGRPTIGLSLVLISPRHPEQAQALRDWGDFIHLRHIAEVGVPGYSMITPYENVTGGDPRFLHFYEMDTDDPEASFQAMTPLVTEKIGPVDSPRWQQWAQIPELRIMYVNSFRRLGASFL
ncbi:MAG: hypothetical protein ACRDY1_00465 [Acidimicrobiales bacterium]